MNVFRLVPFLIYALAASGCASTQDDRVAIYEALFRDAGSRTIFVREPIAKIDDADATQEDRSFYSNFEFEQQETNHRPRDFGSLSVHMVPESEEKGLFAGGCEEGWKRFHAKYPDAKRLFGLSTVGFRAGHSEALVYLTSGQGCLAARGDAVVLKRKEGKWEIVKTWNLWIS